MTDDEANRLGPPRVSTTWGLGAALAELEATDPAVAAAADRYDEVVFRLRAHHAAGVGHPWRLRTGRKVPTNIYVQLGPEPGDDDPQVGVAWLPGLAGLIVQAVNSRLAEVPPDADRPVAGPRT